MCKKIKKVLHMIPGIHFYRKWSRPKQGKYTDTGTTFKWQSTRCKICGKYKERTVN
jgi:hypothetical protein